MPETLVKCLVWDLDNTLWTGTLLEGDQLELRPGVLDVLRELDRRGVLHAVASRNDHDPAWAQLERLGVAEYFVAAEIGWGRKPESVRRIADTLQFALTTVAFVDDQPHERAEVSLRHPEVRVYAHDQVADLPNRPEFTPAVVTPEASARRAKYRAGVARDIARQEFTGPDEDFLRSLDIRMSIVRGTPADLDRLSELTLRTSQMNATGVHYSHDDLAALTTDPDHEVLAVSLADRFGSHGAIGVMLVGREPAAWHVKLLATSCRVVSFGAGAVLLRWLTDQAARAGVHLVADFKPTDRNRIMEITYRFAGFTGTDCACLATAAPPADGVQRLHLVPERQDPSPTIQVEAVDLAAQPTTVSGSTT
jgi:methoxymalonate biosynthesis protein